MQEVLFALLGSVCGLWVEVMARSAALGRRAAGTVGLVAEFSLGAHWARGYPDAEEDCAKGFQVWKKKRVKTGLPDRFRDFRLWSRFETSGLSCRVSMSSCPHPKGEAAALTKLLNCPSDETRAWDVGS